MNENELQRYELNTPDVVSDLLDGEVVIINLDTGVYFRGTGSTAEVWQALIDGADPSALDADRAADLSTFVGSLVDAGLLRQRSTDGSAAFPEWAVGSLSLDSHSDLQDLLALDPVHDVDSATGWPATPG